MFKAPPRKIKDKGRRAKWDEPAPAAAPPTCQTNKKASFFRGELYRLQAAEKRLGLPRGTVVNPADVPPLKDSGERYLAQYRHKSTLAHADPNTDRPVVPIDPKMLESSSKLYGVLDHAAFESMLNHVKAGMKRARQAAKAKAVAAEDGDKPAVVDASVLSGMKTAARGAAVARLGVRAVQPVTTAAQQAVVVEFLIDLHTSAVSFDISTTKREAAKALAAAACPVPPSHCCCRAGWRWGGPVMRM